MDLDSLKIGILTLSDRASSGEYEDRSGPAIRDYMDSRIGNKMDYIQRVIPDDYDRIVGDLKFLSDEEGCHWVCTTGGTGPSARDVTPEATELVCAKMLPGFGEQMRLESLKYVPTAILSRQTAGIRGSTLILNLPGKPKSISECLDAVLESVPYCIDLIGGPRIEFKKEFGVAWRPQNTKAASS